MKMIDVSEFQGKIDYNKVKKDGVEGVIIRAGYGKGNVDGYFTRNITGAIKAKLHVGIYWFSYAYSEEMAKREARFCNDIIEPYRNEIDLPVFFDWEYDSMNYAKKNGVSPDKNLITAMTKAFCDEIKALRWDAGFYTNWDYAKNYYDMDALKDYKLWFADYEDEYKDCYIQQTSSTGVVKGIDGNVDKDVLWGEIKEETKPATNTKPKPKKPAEKPSTKPADPYTVGDTYTISVNTALNVRIAAGIENPLVGYENLTSDGKKHAYYNGALKNGTRVTCLEVKVLRPDYVWIRIPSGWICAIDGNKKYVV